MKKRLLLLSILLIIGIFLSGCSTQPDTSRVGNPQTQDVGTSPDPIIGVWTQDVTTSKDTTPNIYTYIFQEDGKFIWEDSNGPINGQWIKIRENQYVVSYSFTEEIDTYIYNPGTDTLYDTEFSTLTIYRTGKMPSSTIVSTNVPATNVPLASNHYKVGDEIQQSTTDSTYDKDRAWVILKINYDEEKYTVGKLYYDPDARKWFKVNEDLPEIRFFSAVERDYPTLIGTINWDTVPIKYTINTCQGTTVLSYDSKQPECGTGGSSSSSNDGVISGYGDDVIPLNVQTAGLYIFSMSHSGRSNFIVWVKGGDGYHQDLLVNEIGHYSGKKSTRLEKGKYYVDITADGHWTIQIGS